MDLPSCALSCFLEAVGNSTCAISDFACICADALIRAQLEPCVLGACTVKEALHTKNLTYTTCGYPTSNDTKVFPLTNLVGIVVAILAVALRVMYRAMDRRLGLDDIMIIIALLFAAAVSGIGLKLRDYGLGKDMWTIPSDDIRQTLKLFFIEEELYCICVALVKISMLLLYLRLFPNGRIRSAVFVALGLTAAWEVVSFFVLLFSCWPISYYWNQWDGEHKGRCISHNNFLLAHSTINIVLDVAVVCIPMPTLMRLQMPLEKRLGVCVMFAVGIVVTVISIFRLVETVGFNSTTNPTKDFVPVGIWSLLELDVAIMCACLPAIRALVIHVYNTYIKEPIASRISSSRNKLSNAYGSGGGSQTGTGSRSRAPYHTATISNPDNPEQFIRLEDIESGDDALVTPPATASPKTKRHSIFSRRSNEPRSPGSATLPRSPGVGSAHISWLKENDH
ncbi:hypothetical protein BJY01DRAFT_201994 [Aspergillus pseudoustus]|uniref:CFEM domain-containing protein n=1 Tax=Aspergillus pseudoustus TaxID=1810923 RepID=A0ABR4KZL9_9EURO